MNGEPYGTIDIEAYKADYHDSDDDNILVVDVREVDEFEAGHIPGLINLPLSELEERYDELDEDRTILLVCRTGGRSDRAAQFLYAMGYENLINVDGGTLAWAQSGYPLEK